MVQCLHALISSKFTFYVYTHETDKFILCAVLFHVCQLHSESFPKGSNALLSYSHENGNGRTGCRNLK